MGQLFNRITRLARAHWNDTNARDIEWAEHIIDSGDDDLRQAINEATKTISNEVLLAHKILSIQLGSSEAEVKTAYRKSMNQWHPDRYVSGTQQEQTVARQKSQEINAAYLILKNYYGY